MKTRLLFLLPVLCFVAGSWTPPTYTIEDKHNAYLELAKKADFVFEGRTIGYELTNSYIRSKVQITKIYKGPDSLTFGTVEIISVREYYTVFGSDSAYITFPNNKPRAIYMCNINKKTVPPAINFTAEIPFRLNQIAYYHIQGYRGYGDIEKQFIEKLKKLPGIEVKTKKRENSVDNEKVEVTLSAHFSENYEYFSAHDESDTNNTLTRKIHAIRFVQMQGA